jgi:hypothetical protein
LSLRRQLGQSFVVQGAGAASVLLATVWLGASLGPEVQGGFSRSKSEIEFVAALAMFGLPQALFFYTKSGGLGGRQALRWAAWSALLALAIGLAYALAQHRGAGALAVMMLAAAVAANVGQGQLRALLLVRERTVWFNAITALPQVLVLAGVAAVILRGGFWPSGPAPAWAGIFAAAYTLAALLAWRRLRATPDAPATGTAVGWRALGHFGLAAWLTAVLSTAAILAAQRWVEGVDGRAALGQFSTAMTLVQVPLLPISYAAPLLFRRWMEQPGARASRRWASLLFVLLLGAALLVWLLAPVWPDLGLGQAYAGATRALALLLVGGAADAASRLLTVQASASGSPWTGVRAEVARWAVLLAGGGWLQLRGGSPAGLALTDQAGQSGLMAVCAVWAAAAWAAALVFAWSGRASATASGAGATR